MTSNKAKNVQSRQDQHLLKKEIHNKLVCIVCMHNPAFNESHVNRTKMVLSQVLTADSTVQKFKEFLLTLATSQRAPICCGIAGQKGDINFKASTEFT